MYKGKGQETLKWHPERCVKTSTVFLSVRRFVSHWENNEHGNLLNPESNPSVQFLSFLME